MFFELLLAGCIVLTGSSLVSMMGVFMGYDSPRLDILLLSQVYASLLATFVFVGVVGFFMFAFGPLDACREVWRRLPHWLLFAFVSVNSLVIAGELSYFLIRLLTGQSTSWWDRVPLAAGLSGSLAFSVVYALSRLRARQ